MRVCNPFAFEITKGGNTFLLRFDLKHTTKTTQIHILYTGYP